MDFDRGTCERINYPPSSTLIDFHIYKIVEATSLSTGLIHICTVDCEKANVKLI